METTPAGKIARVLHTLVFITWICNLLALPLVPGAVYFRFTSDAMSFSSLQSTFGYDVDDGLGNLLMIYLRDVWQEPYSAVLTLFLLFSGICTAVILWQGLRVLGTILRGTPFCLENAISLQRAAVSSFVISLAALARVIFSLCFFRSLAPLLTYNALFVPIFAMFGLLCLVMSALFRQAAEIKAENDLTI